MGQEQERSLYLSSLESIRFEPVRECRLIEFLIFDSGKIAAVASVQPSVLGQDFGIGEDINTVILANAVRRYLDRSDRRIS
jgi:hypothetical protein